MSQRALSRRQDVHQFSGWLIPLAFAVAILGLCGLFLAWYLRPGTQSAAPTDESGPVALTVRGAAFSIPANYIEGQTARAGGALDSLALVAQFPSMRGYSDEDARLFAGNAPDSPVIHLSLRGDPSGLDAQARLARIYMPSLTESGGTAGPFGLVQYVFRPESGYAQDDLFAGQGKDGLVLILCERASPEFPSPNCIVTDRPVAQGLSLSYRFKRAWLSRWREVASGVDALIARFKAKS
jgi:hypothetical protein